MGGVLVWAVIGERKAAQVAQGGRKKGMAHPQEESTCQKKGGSFYHDRRAEAARAAIAAKGIADGEGGSDLTVRKPKREKRKKKAILRNQRRSTHSPNRQQDIGSSERAATSVRGKANARGSRKKRKFHEKGGAQNEMSLIENRDRREVKDIAAEKIDQRETGARRDVL